MLMVMLMRNRNTERPVIIGPGITNDNRKKEMKKGKQYRMQEKAR